LSAAISYTASLLEAFLALFCQKGLKILSILFGAEIRPFSSSVSQAPSLNFGKF
jgi:hypothetical protein